MSPSRASTLREMIVIASVLEILAWSVCVVIAFFAARATMALPGPLHVDWLACEAIGGGFAAGLVGLSVRRIAHLFDTSRLAAPGAPWVLAGIVARIVVGLPTLLFFIICAAAGFTALTRAPGRSGAAASSASSPRPLRRGSPGAGPDRLRNRGARAHRASPFWHTAARPGAAGSQRGRSSAARASWHADRYQPRHPP